MTRPTPRQLELFRTVERPAAAPAMPPPTVPAPEPSPAQPGDGQEALLPRLRVFMPDRLRSVTLTNNRSSIVSARDHRGQLDIRIHRSFATAPDEALAAVATFLLSPRRSAARRDALAAIRAFFERHQPKPAAARSRRRIVLRPVGLTCDLRQLRDEVNEQYFGGELAVHITWGRAPSRHRRRHGFSVRLGTYSERDRLVRIHRCLDQEFVPRYVVAAVVYHEMLHAALPPVVKRGRRRIHTPEFRRRERLFRHHDEAERWIDRNLKRLVR